MPRMPELHALHALHALSVALARTDDMRSALQRVLGKLSEDMGYSIASITILNRRTGEIFMNDAFGLSPESVAKGRYRLGEGVVGRVIATGEAVVIPRIAGEQNFLDRTESRRDVDTNDISYVSVPIIAGKETIGALSVDLPLPEEQGTLQNTVMFLAVVASVIAQAVQLHQSSHEENLLLMERNRLLEERLRDRFHASNMIGNAKAMREVYMMVEKVAPTHATVLILGESGVGKELVAEAIHYASNRADKPFIACNIAALPESIIESELFGHEKGAFTGAAVSRAGRFETAGDGSIFLDEIGELSMQAQVKLLRVLQNGAFERVGSSKTLRNQARVIAATNKDLSQLIAEGRFREDLYYRLNVVSITVPPLRERKTDIPVLVDHFIEKYAELNGIQVNRISTPAIDMIMSYHWPGNVRELENCIERAVILSEDGVIHGYHLPPTLQVPSPGGSAALRGSMPTRLDAIEREMIVDALKGSGGNMGVAAKLLGISERVLGLRMRKHDLSFQQFRRSGGS
ncbi:MAG: GAF domain-containing protein [Spirochaetaceae bacterium]|nr:MAG: GAF domain-containing protein [Spirochaetaceae bacterium]